MIIYTHRNVATTESQCWCKKNIARVQARLEYSMQKGEELKWKKKAFALSNNTVYFLTY